MIWILPLLASGKIITTEVYIDNPAYLGRFWGENVEYRIACKLENSNLKHSSGYTNLHMLVSEEKLSDISCDNFNGMKILLNVPSYGAWSMDDDGNITLTRNTHFYIADCLNKLPKNTLVNVKLTLKDSVSYEYSWENSSQGYIYVLSSIIQALIIVLCIIEIYKERVEEIPITIIFVITTIYLLSIVFDGLYFWIYGIDGESYKFLLVFGKFFSIFSEISIMGILTLISSNRFNPKDFSIEESEFCAFLGIISLELLLSVTNIIRSEPLEFYDIYGRLEGLILSIERIYLFITFTKYSKNITFARLGGFEKIGLVGGLYIVLPAFLSILWWVLPWAFYEGTICLIAQFSTDLVLLFLYMKFSSNNFTGLLPLKTHNF